MIGHRGARSAVTGAGALTRSLLSAAAAAQLRPATGAGGLKLTLGGRDTLLRLLQDITTGPGAIGRLPVRDTPPAPRSNPAGGRSLEDSFPATLVLEDLEALDPGAPAVAPPEPVPMEEEVGADRDAPGPRAAWTEDSDGPRAPWDRAEQQQAALDALACGTADRSQRDFLVEEIRRQVPDVAYVGQIAAAARTVLALIIPGNRALGLKTLNDHVVGYQINNSMIGPQRNEAVKNAFQRAGGEHGAASPFTVTEQTYKVTTVTSQRPPVQLGAALHSALDTIDRDVPPIYLRGLKYGLTYWRGERERERAHDAEHPGEAARRVANIENAIEQVAAPGFQLDFQFGLAEIAPGAGGGPAGYGAALASHMQSLQAALMSREPDRDRTFDAETDLGDRRGQLHHREAFLRFCEQGEALRQQVIDAGNTLTYGGHQYRVFTGDGVNRDVLRDVRKEKIGPAKVAPGEAETLHWFERYFRHAATFDNMRRFASAKVERVGENIERTQRLIDGLQGNGPVDAPAVADALHNDPGIGEIIPMMGTASEAVFYNTERARTHRIIVSCDVRDMGVDVMQRYGHMMRRVGGSEHADPDQVALEAPDSLVEFRSRAIGLTRQVYRTLVNEAIEAAEQRGDHGLARGLHAEHEPSLLMGGDEITLSLHEGMRPYVPRLAAALMDPDIARARVAISTTGGDPAVAVDEHIRAQVRADPAHSVLKDFEARQRDLELTVEAITDPARRQSAAARVGELGLNRLYAEHEDRGIVLRRTDTGEIVDAEGLRQRIAGVRRRLRGDGPALAW